MAADEIFSNIAKYSKSPDVTVALNVGEGLVEMSFEDRGIPFDPLSAAPPDLSFGDEDHLADVNERNGGGFGIHLTRSLMDGMSYSRDGGRNVLILAKRLRDDECPGV